MFETETEAPDLIASSVTTVTPDVRWLVQELGKRDRLIGKLEEFIKDYTPYQCQKPLERMLEEIASLYTPPPSTPQRPPNTHLSPYELGQE